MNREDFEKRLIIERTKFELFEKHYFGGIEVDLPLRVEEESYLGDLTARIYLRDMGNQELALVLEDIHVL